MRELKFRAWDKVGKKYLYPYPDGFSILGETTCFDLIGQQLHERDPKDKPTLEKLNDIIIEQFTGLHDKNGKEIYEGDIVKNYSSDDRNYTIVTMFDFIYWYMEGSFDDKELEIFGNIHENPELMEDSK